MMKLLLLIFSALQGTAFANEAVLSTVEGKEVFERACSGCHGKDGIAPQELREVFTTIPANLNGIDAQELHFERWLSKAQVEAIKTYLRAMPPEAVK